MSFPWAKHYEPKTELGRWFDERLPLPRLVYNAVGGGYPVPRNLNYLLEFRRPRRDLPDHPDRHRHRPGDALLRLGRRRVQFGRAHHARRQRGLVAALRPRQRRQLLLHRHLHPHLPRPLLRLLQGAARDGVDARPGHLPADDGDRLHGLCPALGADELLGRAGHHRLLLRPSRWSASRSASGCSAATRPTRRR